MSDNIDGVKFCKHDSDVNHWIEENSDKVVVDVKMDSSYDASHEGLDYSCLILYRNK